MTQPDIAEICVQRDPAQPGWRVILCSRQHPGQSLGTFPSFSEAAEFALQERDRRQTASAPAIRVHFPDDCPCYRAGDCGQP